MSALRTAIPQHLRTFVEPQIEQLSLRMESVRCGLYATLPKSLGEGFLWTAALGEECLVSMHSIRLKKPLILEEARRTSSASSRDRRRRFGRCQTRIPKQPRNARTSFRSPKQARPRAA